MFSSVEAILTNGIDGETIGHIGTLASVDTKNIIRL